MDFDNKQHDYSSQLHMIVKDVKCSVDYVTNALSTVQANDKILSEKLYNVENRCQEDFKNLKMEINRFKDNLNTLSLQIKEISQNQQCPQESVKLKRTRSLDSSFDSQYYRFMHINVVDSSENDSGVNINGCPADASSDQESCESSHSVVMTNNFNGKIPNHWSDEKVSCLRHIPNEKVLSFEEANDYACGGEKERYKLGLELWQTEKAFCHTLSVVETYFYEPLKYSNLIPDSDMRFIFCEALFRLYERHCTLLHKVHEIFTEWDDHSYQRLVEQYAKVFTVHGSVARNYVYYATAYYKIMDLVKVYFDDNSPVVRFLKYKNERYQNGGNYKKHDLKSFESCLKMPIRSINVYINIFERFAMTRNVDPQCVGQIQKLVNNFKKINEDINRSIKSSLANMSNENVCKLIGATRKSKKPNSTFVQRKSYINNVDDYEKCPKDVAKMKAENFDGDFVVSDLNMTKFNTIHLAPDDKPSRSVGIGRSNAVSEPSLFRDASGVSYDTEGKPDVVRRQQKQQSATLSAAKDPPGESFPPEQGSALTKPPRRNLKTSSTTLNNSDSFQWKSGKNDSNANGGNSSNGTNNNGNSSNVSVFRNTIAAFFSKRKNRQRFDDNESESVFGTWRKTSSKRDDESSITDAESNSKGGEWPLSKTASNNGVVSKSLKMSSTSYVFKRNNALLNTNPITTAAANPYTKSADSKRKSATIPTNTVAASSAPTNSALPPPYSSSQSAIDKFRHHNQQQQQYRRKNVSDSDDSTGVEI